MSNAPPRTPRTRHPHHDAPDTTADFARYAGLTPGPERDALREHLVHAWLPMARRLAHRYRDRGELLEDLEQVAALGLVKAVERFVPAEGRAFEPFAVPTIVGEIKRHFRDYTWAVRAPRRVKELRGRVRLAVQELGGAPGGRSPTVAQLAAHTGLSEEDVLRGREALGSYRSLSLDAELPGVDKGGQHPLGDTLGTTDGGYDHVVHREAVKPRLRRLPERERRILYLRFFCDQTQGRIAEELGVSQMHVSRLLSRTCARLRHEVEEAERACVR